MSNDYNDLLALESGKQWARIGIERRAGVSVPLFSLYSHKSVGIGELQDIKLLVDWCSMTGNSIIQLLPVNDTGFDFSPYNAQSSFAIDPMYISLDSVIGSPNDYSKEIENLRKQYTKRSLVDYNIKQEKLSLLLEMFKDSYKEHMRYIRFKEENGYWVYDYAVYKVLKQIHNNNSWMEWEECYKSKNNDAIEELKENRKQEVEFHIWVQWQLFEQFSDAGLYAKHKRVLLMGDIPFLVSRDSADVWAYKEYFNLDFCAGAPPDAYNAKGQRWGMPPYNWNILKESDYFYFLKKLHYAENFYDMFRIDHVVGMFRLWTISINEEQETKGLHGKFDPVDQSEWEEHGRKILKIMVNNTNMLACAEDLGVIPLECPKVLKEMCIPGLDVQRWAKNREQKEYSFYKPEEYRLCGCAVVSAHDMSNALAYWKYEINTVDEELFKKMCEWYSINFDNTKNKLFEEFLYGRLRWRKEIVNEHDLGRIIQKNKNDAYEIFEMFRETASEINDLSDKTGIRHGFLEKDIIKAMLKYASSAVSIFSIQSILDYILMECGLDDVRGFRVNVPGTVNDSNWRLRMPLYLEDILNMKANKDIMEINKETGRIVK
ncbi:4-alpha-glucanotransferase [bacterium]